MPFADDCAGVSQSGCDAGASATVSGPGSANASASCQVLTQPDCNTLSNQDRGLYSAPATPHGQPPPPASHPAGGAHQVIYVQPDLWHWALIGLGVSALLAIAVLLTVISIRSDRRPPPPGEPR
jgi:hypothetical protein